MKPIFLPSLTTISVLFSGYVFCSSTSNEETQVRTGYSRSIPYYVDYCHYGEGYRRAVVCGDEYCDVANKMTYLLDNEDSTSSNIYSYNLATFLMYGPERSEVYDRKSLCVDQSLLNDTAGYSYDQLEGVAFQGVLKVLEVRNGSIHYFPFKTSKLTNPEFEKPGERVYGVILSDNSLLSKFTDNGAKLAAARWIALRKDLRRNGSAGITKDDLRLGESMLELKIQQNKDVLEGKTYFASLEGTLRLPFDGSINMHFTSSYYIRFPKPGYNNFRKDVRYKRPVSMVPYYLDESAEQVSDNGVFKLIEIILEPIQ